MVSKPAPAKPPKVPGKKPIDWDRIRAEYEIGGPDNSIRSIAARHEVSHTAINKRRKAEKWPEPGDLDEVIRSKVAEKVSGVVSSGNPQKKAEAVDAEADKRAAVVQRHRAEWEDIEQLRKEVLEARIAPDPPMDGEGKEDLPSPTAQAFERAKLLKIMTEATAIKQAAQRKAYALDAKGGGHAPGTEPITAFRLADLE